ncbi:MAG: RNase adapter RapZ [Pseudomonadota bacterium]
MLRLVILTGNSGSGKSAALNMLEDLDYYCMDNIPAAMLPSVIPVVTKSTIGLPVNQIAVGLDARNAPEELDALPMFVKQLRSDGVHCDILYLQTDEEVLLTRYRETRRRHPMSAEGLSLREAIGRERDLLRPLLNLADLIVDTSHMSVYELRDLIANRVADRQARALSLLIESFGFKHGIPADSDFVFDLRCLPNPYWEPSLRNLTGKDQRVAAFLEKSDLVQTMYTDIFEFVRSWIPRYASFNRSYLTIAIGCTGGQHRSVYVAEKLAKALKSEHPQVHIRHNELP